jgi:hypothetical protein
VIHEIDETDRLIRVMLALGAQAGEARIRDVVTSGGLSHFRRAAETPFNLVSRPGNTLAVPTAATRRDAASLVPRIFPICREHCVLFRVGLGRRFRRWAHLAVRPPELGLARQNDQRISRTGH